MSNPTYEVRVVSDPTAEQVILDDKYWLSRAKPLVEQSILKREEAASKLVAGVGWFWTVYSTAAVAILAASSGEPFLATLSIAAPSALLIIAYLAALRVFYPVNIEFDSRSPSQIRKCHREILLKKYFRLRVAIILSFIAGLAVIVAVFSAAMIHSPVK